MSKNLTQKQPKYAPNNEPYGYYLAADVSAQYVEVLDTDTFVTDKEAVGEIYNLIYECLLQAAE